MAWDCNQCAQSFLIDRETWVLNWRGCWSWLLLHGWPVYGLTCCSCCRSWLCACCCSGGCRCCCSCCVRCWISNQSHSWLWLFFLFLLFSCYRFRFGLKQWEKMFVKNNLLSRPWQRQNLHLRPYSQHKACSHRPSPYQDRSTWENRLPSCTLLQSFTSSLLPAEINQYFRNLFCFDQSAIHNGQV